MFFLPCATLHDIMLRCTTCIQTRTYTFIHACHTHMCGRKYCTDTWSYGHTMCSNATTPSPHPQHTRGSTLRRVASPLAHQHSEHDPRTRMETHLTNSPFPFAHDAAHEHMLPSRTDARRATYSTQSFGPRLRQRHSHPTAWAPPQATLPTPWASPPTL